MMKRTPIKFYKKTEFKNELTYIGSRQHIDIQLINRSALITVLNYFNHVEQAINQNYGVVRTR